MEEYIALVDSALDEYLRTNENDKIYEAMRYSIFAGGKRLRPVIMMMTAKMFGKSPETVLPFACAMEMIHTYSLIHDDLPSMDNDDLRRGKPTNHKVYGEALAILAGDGLLTKAFETAASYNVPGVCKKTVLRAVGILAKTAGADGMIAGQVIDIESVNESEELLKKLDSLKTGAIIRASGIIGALLSGAGEKEIEAVDEFCKNLGIAFQIQDDILDVISSEEELGKPIGSDEQNGKSTYISLFGTEKAKKMAEEYTQKAIDALKIFDNNEELVMLAESLTGRRA